MKHKIESLIEKGYNRNEIAETLNLRIDQLKYRLKKYNLKIQRNKRKTNCSHFKCTKCKITKHKNEFYKNSKGYHWHRCKDCSRQKTLAIQREIKVLAIQYKGGKCEICNYNKCPAALQFHHKAPGEKDPNWKKFKLRTFDQSFKKELDKCILLCANCHAEIHYKEGLEI